MRKLRHASAVSIVLVTGLSLGAACTAGPPSNAPEGAAGSVTALTADNDVPPPAGSTTPIAFRALTLGDAPVRRPLTPMPTAITTLPTPTTKGTVDGSGDETPLEEVLIGTAAKGGDKGKAIDADAGKLANGVRLVLDTPYQIFSQTGSYVHVAAYLASFVPAAGARVFVDGKLVGTADADGAFVFRHVADDGSGSGSHEVTVIAGTSNARVRGSAMYSAYPRTQAFERANLYVYTDRGVFSPGDVVHVRALAWRLRGDYRPFANAPVNVVLRKDGKLLSGGRVETDVMGVATIDLPLPTSAPEGAYELAVEHLGERSTARLQVKYIVAPAVKIEHDLPRFLTRDAGDLPFVVNLAASTGEAFKSGTVVIKALDPKDVVVATETRAVTNGGPHAFKLGSVTLAKMRDAFADDEMAHVVIEVIDAATGRRDELTRDLQISRAPYRLVVEGDRTEHVTGETVKVIVHATDLEGAPVDKSDVALDVHTDGKLLLHAVSKTTAEGLATFTFAMPKGSVDMTASLVKTPSVRAEAYVDNSPPRAMYAEVTEASVIERQNTPIEVHFPSGYVPSERVVHADVTDASGSLVHSFLVPIKNDKGHFVAKGTFPAPSWGSMLLTLFAIGREGSGGAIGLLTDGQNLPVVASRPITVTLKAPSTAAPGQSIELDVALTRSDAKVGPRPFAFGLAITDDAMLALLDPLEHTPTQVLYNPERKVMATTGSQILTWPVVQKTWGPAGETYDIALPPFGFRRGGVAPTMTGKLGSKSTGGPMLDGDLGGVGVSGYGSGGGGSASGLPKPVATTAAPPPPPPPMKKAKEQSKPDDEVSFDAPEQTTSGKSIASNASSGSSTTPSLPTKKPDVKITIRTDFSPTSVWIPETLVEAGKNGGSAHFLAKLPDAITTQRITVVASDDRGALGVGRALIKVDQDLSVRSDLPAALTQGDEIDVAVSVRNARKDAAMGKVTLSSPSLSVIGASTQSISIGAGATSSVSFRIKANGAGRTPFSVAFVEERAAGSTSTAPLRDDTEERSLFVRPRGAPTEARVTGTLEAQSKLAFEVVRDKDDAYVQADLAIAFPSAVPLIEGLDSLVDDDSDLGVDPDASRLLSAIALEGYLLRTKGRKSSIERVHAILTRSATSLLLEQQSDGGWGWRWDAFSASHGMGPSSSAYATTHALLALAKLRDTDVPIPDQAIAAGRSYLLAALDSEGQVDVSNVAFWQGDGAAQRRAATMAAFRSIAATERGVPVYGNELGKLDLLVKQALSIAGGGAGSEDPLTLSSAILGLHLHARARSDSSNEMRDAITSSTKTLLGSYRSGYWEPSWFHAWGGRIEATRGVIELLANVAPGVYDTDLHDAVQFVLSTRPSWGAWHNAWGTAAAIEAMTFLDPTPPEKTGASVAIAIDGKAIVTVKIDPDDPFTSAAALRDVDLSPWLSVGTHAVTLAYDGALSVPATITLKKWTPKKVESFGMKIERALSSNDLTVGASATQVVTLTTTEARPEVIVKMSPTPGLDPDRKALEAMIKAGTIVGYRAEGSLVISLRAVKAGKTELKIPFVAARKGGFSLGSVSAYAPRSSAEAWSEGASFAVK